MYVVLLVCAANIPRDQCDTAHARMFKASYEMGVVCGLPAIQQADSATAPNEGEYVKIKCRAGDRYLTRTEK